MPTGAPNIEAELLELKERLLADHAPAPPPGGGDIPPVQEDSEEEVEALGGEALADVRTEANAPAPSQRFWEEGTDVAQTFRIETRRVIPYATIRIQNSEIDKIQDILEARKLERQLDENITKQLYTITQGASPELILSTLDQVDQEIELVENKIAAVRSLKTAYEQVTVAFHRSAQIQPVTSLMKENILAFGTDPLLAGEIQGQSSYLNLLTKCTGLANGSARVLTTTHLYIQCLWDAEMALKWGASASLFMPGPHRRSAQVLPFGDPPLAAAPEIDIHPRGKIKANNPRSGMGSVNNYVPRVRALGAMTGAGLDFIWDNDPTVRFSELGDLSPQKILAYYCSALSREYLLSAGLGRMAGTSMGQKYQVSTAGSEDAEHWEKKLFGAQEAQGTATRPAPDGSLMNLALVDEATGRPVAEHERNERLIAGTRPVYLFEDIYGVTTSGDIVNRTTTAKRAWFNTLKERPFDNDVGLFEEAIERTLDRLTSAGDFLEILLCRDQERTLLTPRGLFTRIIKDFASFLDPLILVGGSAAVGPAIELAILSLANRPGAAAAEVSFEAQPIDLSGTISVNGEEIEVVPIELPFWSSRSLRDHTIHQHQYIEQVQAMAVEQVAAQKNKLRQGLLFMTCDRAWNRRPSGPAAVQAERENRTLVSMSPRTKGQLATRWPTEEREFDDAILERADGSYRTPVQGAQHGEVGFIEGGDRPAIVGAPGTRHYWCSGQRILEQFTSHVELGSTDIQGIIIKIFEDLQAEAQAMAENGGRTYLRTNGTTLNAGFDGAITIAMLIECFLMLVKMFVDSVLELSYFSTSLRSYRRNVRHPTADFNPDLFQGNPGDILHKSFSGVIPGTPLDYEAMRQHVYINASSHHSNKLNRTRKFLKELALASEANDFSDLFDVDGNVKVMPSLRRFNNLNRDGETSVTPESLVDTMMDLALEDDVPTNLFAIAKSLVQNLPIQTANFRNKAAVLRRTTDTPNASDTDEIILLRQMSVQGSVDHKFITNLSTTQIDSAQKRVDSLKNIASDGYAINNVNLDMFKAYQMLLEEKRATGFSSGVILFLGLPTHSLYEEAKEQSVSLNNIILDFEIDKYDAAQPSLAYETLGRHAESTPPDQRLGDNRGVPSFMVSFSTSKELISEAMAQDPPPANFGQLVSRVKFNHMWGQWPEGITVAEISRFFPNFSIQQARFELESFILKNMYQEMTSLAFNEDMIQFERSQDRDPKVVDLSRSLMAPLGLTDSTINQFFGDIGAGFAELPTTARLNTLTQPTRAPSPDGGVTLPWNPPLMQPAQVSALYNLLSTKPFFVGRVNDLVLTQTVFDKVFAIFVDMNAFEIDAARTQIESGNHFLRPTESRRILNWNAIFTLYREMNAGDLFTMTRLYAGAILRRG